MSKQELKSIVATSELDTAVTAAIVATYEAGATKDQITAVLVRITELLQSDGE